MMERQRPMDLRSSASYTLEDLLHLGSMQGARLLSGDDSVQIRRVNVVESADLAEWAEPGDLILTSGYALRDDASRLRAQLEKLRERGAAGICIKRGRRAPDLPATSLPLPLVQLPLTAVFANIVQEGMEEILSRRIRVFQDIQAATEKLLSDMWQAHTPESGLQVVEEAFHNPVIIFDEENDLILTPRTRALLPGDVQDQLIRQLFLRRPDASVTVTEGRSIPLHIFSAQVQGGTSIVLLEYNSPLSESDWMVLRQVSNSLVLEMKNALAIKKIRRKYKNQFVEDLLTGKLGDDPVKICVTGQTDGYQLSLDSLYRVVVLNLNQDFSEKEVGIIRQIIRNLDTQSLFNVQQGKLILVVENSDDWDKQQQDLFLLAHKLDYLMNKGHITFCVSDPQPLHLLPQAHRQALQISDICQRIGLLERVVTAGQLGPLYLLSMLPREAVGEYLQRYLGPLKGSEKNVSLLDTLGTYLELNCNKQLTAERLHTHYNTIVYRLGRVEELLGCSLADGETQFQLRLAFQLDRLL